MDRLRSPGGCPWDAEQTHESLTRYLLEETYEVLDAIESGDRALLREELGDLLLQVLFHARIAEEADDPFSIDDVARDLVEKLIRRHPHVFAGAQAGDAAALNETWERQKIAEKGRTSAVDGVPLAQPALALATKLAIRAARAGIDVAEPEDLEADEDLIAAELMEVVHHAVLAGVDPEGALRRATRIYRDAIVAAEQSARPDPDIPGPSGHLRGSETGSSV